MKTAGFRNSSVFQAWKKLAIGYKLLMVVMLIYALAGFFLTTAFFAIRFHLTDDPGAVNFNDRKFDFDQTGILPDD
ncbi:MAG: hypothetical protein NTU44_18115, partial [Bacteroidetes bacterium]|nr:hypothetical protein [Bacteroidota bacterium]